MFPSSSSREIDFVTIRTFTTESEANIVRGALEAFNINCIVSRDDCGGQRPHLALAGGVRLLVRAEDAVSAEQVLAGETTWLEP